jgi:hypothetical protein
VALPKQVQAQVEAAEAIEQQLAGQAAPPAETEPPAPEPQAEPPVAAAPVAAPPTDGVEVWQQRFRSLQGRFDAEVPRLHQEVKERNAQLFAMQQEIEKLKAAPKPEPKAETLVTSQDDEKFGGDLIELMRRVVREGLTPALQRLELMEKAVTAAVPQIQREIKQTTQQVAQTQERQFWSELATAVPDYEAVNASPEWLAWLDVYDPVAGAKRQAALDVASNALDYQRVIALFKLFKAQGAPAVPQPQPNRQNPELARQVAPAKSSKTGAVPQGEKTFTEAQYVYWNDPRRLHDTPKEKLAATLVELEIALAEGRIKFS